MQLLDREATLLGAGKCPLYNYVSGMNRASWPTRMGPIPAGAAASEQSCQPTTAEDVETRIRNLVRKAWKLYFH